MTFQYNSADSSLFLLLDWFLKYSRSYDVDLCDIFISYMDNYIPMHFRNHREQRRKSSITRYCRQAHIDP